MAPERGKALQVVRALLLPVRSRPSMEEPNIVSGLLLVGGFDPLEQGVGIVAAGPGKLGPLACFAAEGHAVLEVLCDLVIVTQGGAISRLTRH